MGNVKFIGCLHLGHEWMAKHRGFKDIHEYHEHLIQKWNSVVHKKDIVYIHGDVTMENDKYYFLLDQLKGRKKVILGNHDRGKDIPELLKYVEEVLGMIYYKGYWLTHAPLHPQELSFTRGNIHAHVHEQPIPDTIVNINYWDKKGTITSKDNQGYFNVDAYIIGYTPLTIKQLTVNKIPHFEGVWKDH